MVTGRSPKGVVFIPFHFVEAAANILTDDRTDERAKIPDYKVCAVRVSKTEAPEGADPGTEEPLEKRGAIKDQAKLVH
jgi:predicted molibdopterin-dependent oxidoreductase YjgC